MKNEMEDGMKNEMSRNEDFLFTRKVRLGLVSCLLHLTKQEIAAHEQYKMDCLASAINSTSVWYRFTDSPAGTPREPQYSLLWTREW